MQEDLALWYPVALHGAECTCKFCSLDEKETALRLAQAATLLVSALENLPSRKSRLRGAIKRFLREMEPSYRQHVAQQQARSKPTLKPLVSGGYLTPEDEDETTRSAEIEVLPALPDHGQGRCPTD